MNKRYKDKLIATLRLLIRLEGCLRNGDNDDDVNEIVSKLSKSPDVLTTISETESDHYYNIPDNQMFSDYGMKFLLNSQDCENATKELNYVLHTLQRHRTTQTVLDAIIKCKRCIKNSIER